ncbi:MAG: glycosyltransferase family 2 protein [Anaerolineae bacterium]|nr:glycosyltransferase family 2 protein [Anaerolineae bacterium]
MPRPAISVVIPTHNGARTLGACLEALRASTYAPSEIIVVDDASTDGSGDLARRFDCRVIRVDENIGAARAKNRGARAASGDILFFTDDDVIVGHETLARVAENFADARVAGVVGLLDRQIPFDDFASNIKNLWMRFTYERLPRERIGLFYTSVAAIRREIFLALGGFDENYRGASITEDTEFGQRVWRAGYNIVLDPSVVVTHCKHYTLREVLRTDFLRARALVLMRLRKWGQPFYTSVPLFYQLGVPILFAALVCLALMRLHLLFFAASLVLLITFYASFTPWFAYLARERGIGFAVLAILFQPLDALAVGAGMFIALIEFIRGVRY